MDQDRGGFVPREGMTIVGSDGETVGEIDLVEQNYVIVKKGGIFPQDHFIAVSDITGQDEDGTLRLAIPADIALERGLGNPMAALGGDRDVTTTDPATLDAVPRDETGDVRDESTMDTGIPEEDPGVGDVDTTPEPEVAATGDDVLAEPLHAEATDDTALADHDAHRVVTLSQEELSATTRPVERGVVKVEKKVVEDKVTLEVPLVEDEVHVTRRAVDREIGDDDAPFEERTIEVPLRGQGVEIEKRAHVVEEVEIGKTAHQEIREVTETVRHEEARVETDGAEGTEVDQTEDA